MGGSPSVFCALYQKKLLWENMLSITITQKMRNYVYLCRMKQLVLQSIPQKVQSIPKLWRLSRFLYTIHSIC